MAEVQRRLESLTVEIEELTQVGFFSDDECTTLIKRHFEFENKINSMNKSVQDFKEYVSYVISLYRIIKVRRNKLRIGDKKHHLEYRVLQRVKNLYEMAVARFPQEVDLFFSFFQFCKESNFQHASQPICQTMLKHHKNNEQVWLTAARLTFHEKDDPEFAIKLLQQGIGILESSAALYTECIQYEILSGSKEITEEQWVLLNKKVEIYLTQAKKHVRNFGFYTSLLTFLESYSQTASLQIGIIKYLMEENDQCESAWDYLAQRELEGVHFDVEKEEIRHKVPIGKAFFNCVGIYEKGLSMSNKNPYAQSLWDLYLTRIVDSKNTIDTEKIYNYTRILISAFEKASSFNCLSERFYFTWVDLVDDSKKRGLLKLATEKQPLSADLWTLRLRIEFACDEEREHVVGIFNTGYKCLGEHSLPLWQTMHEYNMNVSTNDELRAFYLLALRQGPNIAIFFKPKYIQWLGKSEQNIDKCREAYKSLVNEKPYCKEMYEIMYKLELNALNPKDTGNFESLHKTACEQFGDELVEVWINYIKFIMDFKTIREAMDKIPKLVQQAKKHLHEDFVDAFESEYDDIVTETQRKKIRVQKL